MVVQRRTTMARARNGSFSNHEYSLSLLLLNFQIEIEIEIIVIRYFTHKTTSEAGQYERYDKVLLFSVQSKMDTRNFIGQMNKVQKSQHDQMVPYQIGI